MKIGLYSPYLDALGGGERYLATIAEGFLKSDNQIIFFWDDKSIIKKLGDRFELELSKSEILPKNYITGGLLNRLVKLKNFDVMIYLSDGSVPLPFSKKNILHFQVPFNFKTGNTLSNKLKLKKYEAIICNSKFTKKFIDKTFNLDSKVIYPPVNVDGLRNKETNKENLILSVGRFTRILGGKKHEVLVNAFKKLINQNPDLKLILAGGSSDKEYVERLKKLSKNFPVEIIENIKADKLKKLYTQAKIYWHAAGFGEDLSAHPERAEHFGISIVEAMSAGAVPIVFKGGGPLEIINEGKNGYLFEDQTELIKKTKILFGDSQLFSDLSKSAVLSSQKFSARHFISEINKVIR